MRIWVGARDAGAANVLLPVLGRLGARGGVDLRVIAEGPALGIFRASGISAEGAPADPGQRASFLSACRRETPPDALLLGTSWGASIEKELLRIGQQGGVPALSVVDHWSKYRERFVEPESGQVRLPTRIGVIDEIALEQAVADGLPRGRLTVTGQPYLQSLAAASGDPALRRRARRLRTEWLGGRQAGGVILFGSELFSDDFPPGSPHDLGYGETDALEGLAQALQKLEVRHRRRLKLVVKLHPKENLQRFRPGPLAQERGFLLLEAEPAWPCLLASDVVVGMTSMLLLEAAILRRPAVSYQPAKGIAAPFIGTETGLVRSARSPEALADHLSDCLSPGAAVPASGSPAPAAGSGFLRRLLSADAADRIADLLMDLRSGNTAAVRQVLA